MKCFLAADIGGSKTLINLYSDKGNILERGTHEQLLAQKGEYYKLFMSQYDFLV